MWDRADEAIRGGQLFAFEAVRSGLSEAVAGATRGLASADRLCEACVDLLDVDGAAISLVHRGSTRGTFGSSGLLSRRLDELQFTFGEGPCFDAVAGAQPVLVEDMAGAHADRWPAFSSAVRAEGIGALFAFPIALASRECVGALDLFRRDAGALVGTDLAGGLLAAELAAVPLMDLMTSNVDWGSVSQTDDVWSELESLQRVEVYQATGAIMGQLDVGSTEALVRLRAHAFAQGMTASEVALAVLNGSLRLEADTAASGGDGAGGGP